LEHCYNIRLDYLSSFQRLVSHVIEGHHRLNPFFMAGYRGNLFSDERLAAYKEVLQDNGMPVVEDHIAYGDFWEEPARVACEAWLEKEDDYPDAIICANDTMALAVMGVLEEHHIDVPGEVIVTGFDGISMVDYCTPRLTTARVEHEEVVAHIFDLLLEIRNNPHTAPHYVVVPSHIRRGETCGCSPVQVRRTNQHVLDLCRRMDKERLHINNTLQVLTELTEGHSVMEVLERLETLIARITRGDFYLYVNKEFCNHTDIPIGRHFKDNDMLLMVAKTADKYIIPLREISPWDSGKMPDQIWTGSDQTLLLPFHWQDEVYGYMALQYYEQGLDYERLNDFIMTIAQVLGTVRKLSQLHEMYIRDSLTGLYNRRGFYGELDLQMEQLEGQNPQIFLVSADLDKLKQINDHHGHGEGDVAIKAVATALEEVVGENGFCARFGGDEYVAAVLGREECFSDDYIAQFRENLQTWLDHWNEEQNKPYTLGASVGAILKPIKNVEEIDELMKQADDNMYNCKERHHAIRESVRSSEVS
jgi:diguanylate cyclase (GGDEF)-like protein